MTTSPTRQESELQEPASTTRKYAVYDVYLGNGINDRCFNQIHSRRHLPTLTEDCHTGILRETAGYCASAQDKTQIDTPQDLTGNLFIPRTPASCTAAFFLLWVCMLPCVFDT